MIGKRKVKLVVLATVLVALCVAVGGVRAQQQEKAKTVTVQACDGAGSVELTDVRPGERLTADKAQAVSDRLMELWYARQEPVRVASWKAELLAAQQATQNKPKSAAPAPSVHNVPSEQTTPYTERDKQTWERELKKEIAYGDQLFHDDQLIGSTIGVACAMCHPNASNTHPETYPKFQVQLAKVALLRDMVNWCIENPIQGKKLAPDDPKMRALEAYIIAQRKGKSLEYGKH